MSEPEETRSKWELGIPEPWRFIPNWGLPPLAIPVIHGVWAAVLACAWHFHNLETRQLLALFVASSMPLHYLLRSLAGKSGRFLLGTGEITMWEHREFVFVFDLTVVLVFVASLLEVIFGPGTFSALWRLWLAFTGLC